MTLVEVKIKSVEFAISVLLGQEDISGDDIVAMSQQIFDFVSSTN